MSTGVEIVPMDPKVQLACIVIGTLLLLKGVKGVTVVSVPIPPVV